MTDSIGDILNSTLINRFIQQSARNNLAVLKFFGMDSGSPPQAVSPVEPPKERRMVQLSELLAIGIVHIEAETTTTLHLANHGQIVIEYSHRGWSEYTSEDEVDCWYIDPDGGHCAVEFDTKAPKNNKGKKS